MSKTAQKKGNNSQFNRPVERRKRVDWCRYTDFGSRRSTEDLAKLCAGYNRTQLDQIFSTIDERGLCPIHWSAIHNRSDMIKYMASQGSSIRLKCNNRLFSNGSPLHLAAMNGSIEAAAMLLSICPADQVKDWLQEKDDDGQTALMRAAVTRSKRLDTIRDLLRKNLWSLNGRPSEMALFLISSGAQWAETDDLYGMNLFHLAIVNDHDDIVHMLLSIDRKLISVEAQIGKNLSDPPQRVSARSRTTSSLPLIDERDRANRLVASGLKPLQLAILYNRVSMIKFLWTIERLETKDEDNSYCSNIDRDHLQKIINRAFWLSKSSLKQAIKHFTLKLALILDVSILTLVWLPVYLGLLDSRGESVTYPIQGGFFLIFYCLTLALTARVMFKSPGYLKRNTAHYSKELKDLTTVHTGSNFLSTETSKSELTQKKAMSQTSTLYNSIEGQVRLLCHKCRCVRRPRTKHCNYCNRCVKDFDHHCIYLSACIGRGNRLDFLLLQFLMFLTAIYGSVLFISRLRHTSVGFWDFVAFVCIAKYILIGGVSSFQNLKRACSGVTLYESIRGERIRQIFGSCGPPGEINRSHRIYTTNKNSFWRYPNDRFLSGDLPMHALWDNFKDFVHGFSCDFSPTGLLRPTELA